MAKTFKDLLLALINATLILLALCLFLGLKLAQKVEDIQAGFVEEIKAISPVREQAAGIRDELAGLRGDLAEVRAQTGALSPALQQRLNLALQRLENIENRIETTQSRMAALADSPEDLINHAITTSAESLTDSVNALRGCEPST